MKNNNYIKYFYILISTLSSNFIKCSFGNEKNIINFRVIKDKDVKHNFYQIKDAELDNEEKYNKVLDLVLSTTGMNIENNQENKDLNNKNDNNDNNEISKTNGTILYESTIQCNKNFNQFKINQKKNNLNALEEDKQKKIRELNEILLNLFLDKFGKGKCVENKDLENVLNNTIYNKKTKNSLYKNFDNTEPKIIKKTKIIIPVSQP